MDADPTVARRRSSRLPWMLVMLLLWSGLALGALSLGSSQHRVFHDLLSEQQLLEVEDLSLSLLQGGGLGPLSLPPDLPELDPECRERLLDFANSSAELTGCLVRSARPVRLCQTCHLLFQQVVVKMDNISRAVGVGSGAYPGPVAWRVGNGEDIMMVPPGGLGFPNCEKKGVDWGCEYGSSEKGGGNIGLDVCIFASMNVVGQPLLFADNIGVIGVLLPYPVFLFCVPGCRSSSHLHLVFLERTFSSNHKWSKVAGSS